MAEALLAPMEHLITEERARDVAEAVVYDLAAAGHLRPADEVGSGRGDAAARR